MRDMKVEEMTARPHVEVLDHGYVELVETWGSEEQIIEAARMSTGKGFLGWGPRCQRCGSTESSGVCHAPFNLIGQPHEMVPGDEKLLRYLYTHKHMSPFEMAGATFEVQAPIFVFREWHRHRTQSYNEMSARYTPLPDLNYVPTAEVLLAKSGKNKQAQGTGEVLTREGALAAQSILRNRYEMLEASYQHLLAIGVTRELARLLLPVARYSRMRAQANLRNWLQFLTLRCDPNAQWEIRQYAEVVLDMLEGKFPRVMELWGQEGVPQ